MANADKAIILNLMKQWRTRSGLSVEAVLARMQTEGVEISRAVFENKFTTRPNQAPYIPPEMVVAVVRAFTMGLLKRERAIAAEALSFASAAGLPFQWLPRLALLFPPDEFAAAYQHAAPGLPALVSTASTKLDLPATLTPFIGREQELSEVKRLVQHQRLVTLTGAGGTGKTRLALMAAQQLQSVFTDGAAFVSLEGVHDATLVWPEIAAALRLQPNDSQAMPETVLNWLKTKALVLVLDNCEHLAQSSAQAVHLLLQECPQMRVLVTSRQTLNLPGEVVWLVPPLSVPAARSTVRDLEANESVRLFVDRAQAVLPSFTFSERNAAAIARICRQLDGLPLAIELAAAHIALMPAEQLAARLEGDVHLLDHGYRQAPGKHHTLSATLDWSYALLTETERRLLRWLAVFRGGFTLEAVERVWAASPEVVASLAQLVAKSLVMVLAQPGQRRYRLLEVIRQYALEKLEASGELPLAAQQHLAYYLALAEAAEAELHGPDPIACLHQLELEHDNLQAALRWSQSEAGEPEAAMRLVGALWLFWDERGYRVEGRQWVNAALARSGALPASPTHDAQRAKALRGAGVLAFSLDDHAVAREHFEASWQLFQKIGDRRNVARVLSQLGGVLSFGFSQPKQARAYYDQSLDLFTQLNDQSGLAVALEGLGHYAYSQGEYAKAHELFERCLALQRALGDKRRMAWVLRSLGMTARDQGAYDQALQHYADSRDLFRELEHPSALAYLLIGLGRVAWCQGNFAEAAASFTESLSLFRNLNNTWGLGQALNGLGDVARYQADPLSARQYFEESLALFREHGNKWSQAWAYSNLGYVECDLGNLERAATLHRQAIGLRLDLGDKAGLADSLEGFADLATARREAGRALRLFGAAEVLREQIGVKAAPVEVADLQSTHAAARAWLDSEQADAAWAEGRAMPLADALTLVLSQTATRSA